jgi:hypothetical protein
LMGEFARRFERVAPILFSSWVLMVLASIVMRATEVGLPINTFAVSLWFWSLVGCLCGLIYCFLGMLRDRRDN